MKTHLLLSLCVGTLLLANCAVNDVNTSKNAPLANNANANKTANPNTNAVTQTPKPAESPAAAKTDFSGNWDSEQYNKKGNEYTQLSLFVKQNGETVTGTYSVIGYIGKEPQIEDGNQTAFTGTIKDGVATIKFDPDATVPGYEENVKYKEPASGKPATATLTTSGDKLQWKLTAGGGESTSDMPKEIALTKAGRK